MEALLSFWDTNLDAILISLGIGFVFFVLGPMGFWFSGKKIRRERIGKAVDMMIDLIEGMIVNQEDITNLKLRKLFGAIEREVDVTIDSAYDLERLFEDVSLRFQRSKHLDAQQKNEYAKKLSELSDLLKKSGEESQTRVIPRKYTEIVTSLEHSVETQDGEGIRKGFTELKEKLSRVQASDDPIFRMFFFYKRILRERPWVMVAVLAVYGLIIAIAFYLDILEP